MELFVPPRIWRPVAAEYPEDEAVRRIREVLTSSIGSFLDPERLQAIAEDHGAVERRVKIHTGRLIVALILSALRHAPDTEGRWLDAHTLYDRLGGPPVKPTALRTKIQQLEPTMRVLLRRRVFALQEGTPALQGRLQNFADVLIPDGCAFKIASALAGILPGTGTPAEFKLHAVYSVRAGGLDDLATSAGSVHDTVGFDPDWVRAALYIWDLGYQDYDRFVAAVLAGAVPLQRLKDKLNPVVLAHYDADGKRHPLRGPGDTPLRLEDACAGGYVPTEGTLDFDVVIQDSQGRKVEARVVCVPHQQQDRWYLTTLPRTCFTPFDVAEIYRVRWEVELFFRDLKGAVRLDEVTRLSNPSSLRVALLASLIAATLGQELTRSLNTAHASLPGTEPEPNVIETLPRSPQVSPARPSASFSSLSTARPGRRGERRRTG